MGLSINDALFNLSYWKIAGLWPAIFSGTPGNFKAEYSGLCLNFQAIENPLLQNYSPIPNKRVVLIKRVGWILLRKRINMYT